MDVMLKMILSGLLMAAPLAVQAQDTLTLPDPSEDEIAAAAPAPAADRLSTRNEKLAAEEARVLAQIEAGIKTAAAAQPAESQHGMLEVSFDKTETKPEAADVAAPKIAGPDPAVQKAKPKTALKVESKQAPATSAAAMVAKVEKSNIELGEQLKRRETRIRELETELEDTRNRLILAETEVERISKRIDAQNRAQLSSSLGIRPKLDSQPATAPMPAHRPPLVESAVRVDAPAILDMPLVTVIKDKVALRAGPGQQNSPLMHVPRGTRLTVEKRQGDWFMVNTPSGTRAWVSAAVVKPDGSNFGSLPNASTMKGEPYADTDADGGPLK